MKPTGIEYAVGSGSYVDIDADTSDYRAIFLAESDYRVTATIARESRRNTTAMLDAISVDGRTIPMFIQRNPSGSTTMAQFHNNVKRWFDPGKGRSGTRYLRILGDDGTTSLRLPVHIVSLVPRPNLLGVYDVVLEAVTPYFEELTETSDAITGSGTTTNDGNARAQVRLEMASGTSISGNRYTITDRTGRGVVNYPYLIADTAATQTQSIVLVNGISVPFIQGATSADYWIFIDLPANGSITVDVLRGTGVTNPLRQTDAVAFMGNLDPDNTSNASLNWSIFSVSEAAARTGTWQPAVIKSNWTDAPDVDFGLFTDSSTTVRPSISTSSDRNRDANAILLSTGVPAAASSALTNLSRNVNLVTGTGCRAFVRYRTYTGQWVGAWTSSTDTTVTTSLDVTGATEIVAGIESNSDTVSASNASVSLTWASTPGALALNSSQYPSISSATALTWRKLNGTITNTSNGQVVTLDNVIRRDGTLVIDTSNTHTERAISNSVDGPILGEVRFSDAVDLFSLDPGENSISETVDGSVTVKHRGAWL